jgi:hypothetical protein
MSSLPPARDVLGRGGPPPADRSDPSGWGPPTAPTGPRGNSPPWVIVLAAGVALAALLAVVGFTGSRAADRRQAAIPALFQEGSCVRSVQLPGRHGPHPGDAGQGGGVLRVGDCVVDVDRVGLGPVPEVACADPKAAYQVAARAVHKVRCPERHQQSAGDPADTAPQGVPDPIRGGT